MAKKLTKQTRCRAKKANRRWTRNHFRLELLEQRQLLAVMTTFVGGVLTFNGDGDNDTVVVQATSPTSVIYDDGTGLGNMTATGVDRMIFNADGGNDRLILFSIQDELLFSPPDGVFYDGGLGDDVVRLASAAITNGAGFYDITGPDSGVLNYTAGANNLVIGFDNLELIEDTIQAETFETSATNADETINVIIGPTLPPIQTFRQGPVYLDGGDWDEGDHFRCSNPVVCGDDVIETVVDFVHGEAFNPDALVGKDILVVGAHPGVNISLSGVAPTPEGYAYFAADEIASRLGLDLDFANAEVPAHNEYTGAESDIIALDFEDISGTGTNLNFTANSQQFTGLPLDFTFDYFGTPYIEAGVVSEGYITLGVRNQNIAGPGANASTTRPNATIGGWWEDLNPAAAGADVYYQTLGTAPNRRFIVQYDNVPFSGGGGAPNTFQIKLFEGSNNIEMHYQSISDDGDGNPQQISVENEKGSIQNVFFRDTSTTLGATNLNGMGLLLQPDGTAHAASLQPSSAINGADLFDLSTVDFDDYDVIYLPTNSQDFDDTSGPSSLDLDMLAARKDEIQSFVRQGGGVVAFTEQRTGAQSGAFGWLELPDLFQSSNLGAISQPLRVTQAAADAGLTTIPQPNAQIAYHLQFTGPPAFNGLDPFVIDPGTNGTFDSIGNPVTQINPDDRIIALGQGGIDEQIGGAATVEINDGGNGDFTTILAGRKTAFEILALGGDDDITVGSTGDDLSAIGSVLIDGGNPANFDTLTIIDDGDLTGDDVTILGNLVSGLTSTDIPYFNIDILSVTTTSGDDNIDLDIAASFDLNFVNVNGAAGVDIFGATQDIKPSLTVPININGGIPSAPTLPGDQLFLDMSETTAVVIVDTVGGIAFSQSHADITFSQIETIDVDDVSGNVIPYRPIGDLYARLTEDDDDAVFSRAPGNRLTVRINDVFYGPFDTFGLIVCYARDGNDRVAVAGNVRLSSELYGENGRDYLAGGTLADTILGGSGNDIILGGEGDNTLIGETGNDRIEGRAGNDTLFGNAGNDKLLGRAGDDTMFGGSGNDNMAGGNDSDYLNGEAGNDIISGERGDDIVIGAEGSDRLWGHGEDDLVIGGSGVDRVDGDTNNDLLIGAATVYDAPTPANIAALQGILALWTQDAVDIDVRRADIFNGVGVAPLNGSTVPDDGDTDVLVGDAGGNWFLIYLANDEVYAPTAADRISNLPNFN